MKKTILITGATDGIGLATAKMLVAEGHHLLLHGRNAAKLEKVAGELAMIPGAGRGDTFVADLSRLEEVSALAAEVAAKYSHIDVLINNAGVFRVASAILENGLDARFAVNAIAPLVLTEDLLPLFGTDGRIINLSSAAQARVDLDALSGKRKLSDGEAYAQSKLALTMWSRAMARSIGENGPAVIAVNPGSLLGSKMVKEAYGLDGADLKVGADILRRAALSNEFAGATGKYFDNDSRCFADPHPHALDDEKCNEVIRLIQRIVQNSAIQATV